MNSKIDSLLERYLSLLDEYTKLREALGATQRLMYQNIARANFSAERGMRYGPDHFDERMQAVRKLRMDGPGSSPHSNADTPGGAGNHRFVVTGPDSAAAAPAPETPAESDDDENSSADSGRGGDGKGVAEDGSEGVQPEADKKTAPARPKDPLRWFGLFTPAPLRSAQSQAIQLVEEVVPRLATVMAEMANVEIEVRRARKKRVKAAAAAAARETKEDSEVKSPSGPEIVVS